MRDGSGAVLKLGVPCPELAAEIEALRLFAGRGVARLIDADAARGALVIERLRPGTMLVEHGLEQDDAATEIATALLPELHRPAPSGHPLPTLATWTQGILRAKSAGFAPSLIDTAIRLRDELLQSATASVLLHGDLHHFNILRAERQPRHRRRSGL
jgi:streptomycin 6-kinase